MITVNLVHNKGFKWYNSGAVWVKGYLFDSFNRLYADDLLPHYFLNVHTQEEFQQQILAANGSFAVVIQTSDGRVYAAVDRLRSMPLFYGQKNSCSYLSDDAYWIRSSIGETAFDSVSEYEFLRTGYVVGSHTLSPSVKQLQAGEHLVADSSGVASEFYYKHFHGNYLKLDESDYFDKLEAISNKIFERLITSAAGRPLVVPLSGGYDSRYIVAMLKKLQYKNVICFSYGHASSFEIATARKVAEILGFPWHLIEYTPEKWKWYFTSNMIKDYNLFASNLCSLPHIQEPLALKELQESGRFPHDSIFVPGFCGDLLGGSYIPRELYQGREDLLLKEGIVEYIYRSHFNLSNNIPAAVVPLMYERIAETLRHTPQHGGSIEEFVSLNELWFTDHKVAKFVVNALRAYEFFGYSWRMPLWDNALTSFWYRVPTSERMNDKLYDRYLMKRVFAPFRIDFRKGEAKYPARAAYTVRRLLPQPFVATARTIYWKLRSKDPSYDINAFAYLAEQYYRDLKRLGIKYNRSGNVNQSAALWMLRKMQQE
jgi:asparagine synthase (glutamine-hydrolysing)